MSQIILLGSFGRTVLLAGGNLVGISAFFQTVLEMSRGFFLAYFEHISQKDNSQAQGSVVKTMISKQICL